MLRSLEAARVDPRRAGEGEKPMNISKPYQIAVALAEILQGACFLLTLTLWRPIWATELRLRGLIAQADKLEGETDE